MNSVPDLIYIECLFWKRKNNKNQGGKGLTFAVSWDKEKLLVFSYTDEKPSVWTLLSRSKSEDNVAVSWWKSIFQEFMEYMPEPMSIKSEGKIEMLIVYLWIALSVGGWRINRSEQKKKVQGMICNNLHYWPICHKDLRR